jgi:hypothetical protein
LVEDRPWDKYRRLMWDLTTVDRPFKDFTESVKTPVGNVVQDWARVLLVTVALKQVSVT